MRALALGAALFLQVAVSSGSVSEPKFLRFQREITVDGGGTACATLDAAVFAHVESRAADDLRLFTAAGEEVPFALTENAPQPEPPVVAAVEGMRREGDRLAFDLRMPARVYSEVDLRVNAKEFVAVAEVTDAESATRLGTFTLFDLGRNFGSSTALTLAEATAPKLHVVMRFYRPDGAPFTGVPEVLGADVPASREAQAVYTVVAQTDKISQEGSDTVARVAVPAHVPVERVSFAVDGPGNFARTVRISENPTGGSEAESVAGEISRTQMTLPGVPTAPPVHERKLSVDAVLAANLRRAAVAEVRIVNGASKPVPLRTVALEMRQRKICFGATAGIRYILRYGDPALRAPLYEYARNFEGGSPANAVLGPERLNPKWTRRVDARGYLARHPEWIWVVMIAIVALFGATTVSSVKHRGHD